MRLTAAAQRKTPTRTPTSAASVPASIGGWNTISPLADMPPTDAVQLDNLIPRAGWLEPRRGFMSWATGMGSSTPVNTLMTYYGVTTQMFSVAGTTIWDVTASGAAVATTVTSLSTSKCQYVNFVGVDGKHYLVVCNGQDATKLYDGTTWSDLSCSPADPATFIQPHVYQGRLWFVVVDSATPIYLDLGAIAGTSHQFALGSFMGKGGFINAIGSWTIDTRQNVDDYIAYITSRGQVIVYAGTNPADAAAWTLVGIYDVAPPIGRRCFLKITGDLELITVDGVMSANQMLSTDRSAANRTSLTEKILPSINDAVATYGGNFGWQLISYPKGSLAILNIPIVENSTAMQFVMNTITGSWCRFPSGLDANCWELLNDTIFFGGNDGAVYEWDTTSGDGDASITGTVGTAFNYFETRGRLKRWNMIRPILTTDGSVTPGIGMNVDFGTGATISTPSTVTNANSQWDVATWDVAEWPQTSVTNAFWQAVIGVGQCASILTQVTTAPNGSANGVTLRLNGWDLTMEVGGFV